MPDFLTLPTGRTIQPALVIDIPLGPGPVQVLTVGGVVTLDAQDVAALRGIVAAFQAAERPAKTAAALRSKSLAICHTLVSLASAAANLRDSDIRRNLDLLADEACKVLAAQEDRT